MCFYRVDSAAMASGTIASRPCLRVETRSGTANEQHRNARQRMPLSLLTDRWGETDSESLNLVTFDRVAPGRCRPGAPSDPYVRTLAHTVPRPTDSPSTMVPEAIRPSYGDMRQELRCVQHVSLD